MEKRDLAEYGGNSGQQMPDPRVAANVASAIKQAKNQSSVLTGDEESAVISAVRSKQPNAKPSDILRHAQKHMAKPGQLIKQIT